MRDFSEHIAAKEVESGSTLPAGRPDSSCPNPRLAVFLRSISSVEQSEACSCALNSPHSPYPATFTGCPSGCKGTDEQSRITFPPSIPVCWPEHRKSLRANSQKILVPRTKLLQTMKIPFPRAGRGKFCERFSTFSYSSGHSSVLTVGVSWTEFARTRSPDCHALLDDGVFDRTNRDDSKAHR